MSPWFADRLLTGSLEGAVLIAIVWLAVRRLPGIRASVQATLWWLVALKLLLTLIPVPSVSIPVLPARAGAGAAHAELATSHLPRFAAAAAAELSAGGLRRGPPAQGATASAGWLMGLVGLWCAGLGVQAIRLLIALHTVRSLIRRSEPPAPEDVALVAQLARVVGLTRIPEVRASGDIDSTQLAGVRRPIVLVPRHRAAALTPDERAMALCHELVHVRRRDLALGWVPLLAQHVFFFHPLVRLASREYLTAREGACDAAVVSALGVPPKDYGQLLLRVAVRGPVPAFAAGSASPSTASLGRRLQMLQYVGSVGAGSRLAWCMAAMILVAMLPFELAARTPAGQAPAAAGPITDAHDSSHAAPAVPNPAPTESSVMPPAVLRTTLSISVSRTDESGSASQARDAASAERQADQERRQAVEELPRRLAREAEETLQKSRLQEADIQRLRDRLADLRSVQEKNLAAIADAEEQLMRLRFLDQQREHLAREEHTLLRFQQELAERQEHAAAAQRQLARSIDPQPAEYTRGQVVSLTPSADGTRLPKSTVLAGPGDRIEVSRAGVLVNGSPVTDLSRDFVAGLPEDTWTETLPAGHYFLAGEERTDSGVIRFWGLLPRERIAGKP
jgi:beta-lactamase regulating signal transducer with metallopeptidase domain